MDEARSTLYHALPHDIVMKNVLPFLDLPSYTFEVDDYEDEERDSEDEDEMDDYDYEDEESDSDDEDEMDE